MTTTYTYDIFSTLDGFASYRAGDWGGYWSKEGPELLDRRLAMFGEDQRLVLGRKTFQEFLELLPTEAAARSVGEWNTRMRATPATVVSNTLEGPFDWPDATIVGGDAIDVVTRLKEESSVPLRSHGSLSLNRALLNAGLIDYIQLTVFPVITGKTGDGPIFAGAADFDLDLIESRTLDGRTQELIYRPTLRG